MSRRGDTGSTSTAIGSRNVFAALETLKKKKKTGKAKEEAAPAPVAQTYWAPTPLASKKWADVEDEDEDDYYDQMAPPSAWGVVTEPKKISKEVAVVLEEESESEDDGLDEVDDDVVDVHSKHQLEVPAPAEKPPATALVPKDAERQLSKKEIKKKELAELDAVLAELGISAEENNDAKQDETKGVAEVRKQDEHIGSDEKKENGTAPVESKTSKKKKAKKEKSSKETKDSPEQRNGFVPNGPDSSISASSTQPEISTVDMKERLKKMASSKKKSGKELDSSARAAAVEAAARSAKLAAAKKKEKNHYNQQPVR